MRSRDSRSPPVPQRQQASSAPTSGPAQPQLAQRRAAIAASPLMARQAQFRQDLAASPRMATQPVIQAKVMVGRTPAVMLDQRRAIVGGEPVALGGKGVEWVNDGYRRSYASNTEFKAHLAGAPVDVGLAKKLGRWYRLPYFSQKQFFVLGENHGVFGYRELMKESNQRGKVLGEGGANPLLSATPQSPLSATPQGLPGEHTMENVAAKAYYGLTLLRAFCNTEIARAKAGQQPKVSNEETLPEHEWLGKYQQLPKDERKTGTGLNLTPYFAGRSNAKIFAKFGSAAENYNPRDTAFRVVTNLDEQIDAYQGPSPLVPEVKLLLTEAIANWNSGAIDYVALKATIDQLYVKVQSLAFAEATQMNGGADPTDELKRRMAKVEANQSNYTNRKKRAFAHRDFVMYKSVLKARDSADYAMAGMGDNHAANLAEDFGQAGIPVVRFSEFAGARSTDALAPLKEQRGYGRRLEKAQEAGICYLLGQRAMAAGLKGMPPAARSSPVPSRVRPLLLEVSQSPGYRLKGTIEPRFVHAFDRLELPLASAGKPLKRSAVLTMPQLAQARKALAGTFVLPAGAQAGGAGTALALLGHHAPQSISLATVFDGFARLAAMAGPAPIDTSGTLRQILDRLLLRLPQAPSQALVLAGESAHTGMAAQLRALLQLYGLSGRTIADLLRMAQNQVHGAGRGDNPRT